MQSPYAVDPKDRHSSVSFILSSLVLVLSPGFGREGDLKFVTWMETRGLAFFVWCLIEIITDS